MSAAANTSSPRIRGYNASEPGAVGAAPARGQHLSGGAVMAHRTCGCGCGEPVDRPTARFISGHNSRVRPRRLRNHGTRERYRQGCRCADCRVANTQAAKALRRAHGDPTITWRDLPLRSRLIASIERDPVTGCWIWQKSVGPVGYGVAWDGKRTLGAHRLSYREFVGPIPDGLHIDHLCAVPSCINPEHLEAVTQAENNRRAWQRKLAAR